MNLRVEKLAGGEQKTFFDYPDRPVDPVRKWTAVDADRQVLTDPALFFLRACALIAVEGSVAAGVMGASDLWTSIGWAIELLLVFTAGQLIHTRRHRRLGGITPAEIDRVVLARVEIQPRECDIHPRPAEATISHRALQAAAQIDSCLANTENGLLAQ